MNTKNMTTPFLKWLERNIAQTIVQLVAHGDAESARALFADADAVRTELFARDECNYKNNKWK